MTVNRAGKVIARPKWQANDFVVCMHEVLGDLVEKAISANLV